MCCPECFPFSHVVASFCPSSLSLLLPELPSLLSTAFSAWSRTPAGQHLCVSICPAHLSILPSVPQAIAGTSGRTQTQIPPSHLPWQVLGCRTCGTLDRSAGRTPWVGRAWRGDGGQTLHEESGGEARGRWGLERLVLACGAVRLKSLSPHQVSWVLLWARTRLSRAVSGFPSQNKTAGLLKEMS